jgi:integrase
MKSKRGNGEGSLFERKAPGRKSHWVAALGYNGRRYVAYAATKSEARATLNKLIQKRDAGRLGGDRATTVSAFLERWLESAVKGSVRTSTHRLYKGMVKKHVAPRIGSIRLERLSPADVHNFMADMEANRASGAVRHKVYNIIHAALGQALKLDMVTRNVADAVSRPRVIRKHVETLSTAQAKVFLEAAASDRLYALFLLAIHTGMRQGELLALQWSDVDLKKRVLSVRHTLSPIGRTLEATKTPGSVRRIELTRAAAKALKAHQARTLAEGLRASPFVFCDTQGGPINKDNLMHRSFRPILEQAELPPVTFHALRHTCASLLLSQGANVKQIQELLGHSSSRVTLDVYAHLMPTMQREAMDKLDRLLG